MDYLFTGFSIIRAFNILKNMTPKGERIYITFSLTATKQVN